MSKFVDYLKTKQFYINLGIALGSVIVIFTLVFLSLGYYTRHGSGIPVPALVGTNIDKATELLDQQGFKYQIDSVYVVDKAPGTIIIQDPDAGTNVKESRTIYLTVVKSLAPPVALPDLTQDTYSTAVANIKNYGLKIGDTTYAHDIARDRVLQVKFAGQILTPGSKIPKGSRIDLVLGDGKGAAEVAVPDLVGQDFDAAKFVLSNSGLTLGTVTYGVITDSTKMVVQSQVPAKSDSTSKVSIGTRVNLTVVQKN